MIRGIEDQVPRKMRAGRTSAFVSSLRRLSATLDTNIRASCKMSRSSVVRRKMNSDADG
jgi:hypothetical protein